MYYRHCQMPGCERALSESVQLGYLVFPALQHIEQDRSEIKLALVQLIDQQHPGRPGAEQRRSQRAQAQKLSDVVVARVELVVLESAEGIIPV